MAEQLLSVAIGFLSGILSGLFGIGGGIITTPAIRLVLGAPAIVAVATPLPAIIPGAVTGAVSYARARVSDVRAGIILGAAGAPAAIGGALLVRVIGGTALLLATAALVVWAAGDMLLQTYRLSRTRGAVSGEANPNVAGSRDASKVPPPRTPMLVVIGASAGVYSGLLGLGGGFVLVPLMTRFLRFPMKRAIGTSLVAITLIAIPGTVTHAALGNIDWTIALPLIIGVVPGALLGARISLGSSERFLRVGFAVLLLSVGVLLALNTLGWL